MKTALSLAFACAALLLGACSGGGFGEGNATPNNILPPSQPQSVGNGPNGSTSAARPNGPDMSSSPGVTPSGDVGAYPFSQVARGLQCPQQQGFSCFVQFNISATATQSPSSSPSPSPTPSAPPTNTPQPGSSASPTPSASPAAPMILIQLAALPTDAPHMVAPGAKGPPSQALLTLRVHTDADVKISGSAIALFTLPKAQLPHGRAFAMQLFHETLKRRNTRSDRFFGSYSEFTQTGGTLRFAFTPPAITIKKDELWLFVLYGNGTGMASPSPSPSTSPSAAPSVTASPMPTTSPSATPAP